MKKSKKKHLSTRTLHDKPFMRMFAPTADIYGTTRKTKKAWAETLRDFKNAYGPKEAMKHKTERERTMQLFSKGLLKNRRIPEPGGYALDDKLLPKDK